MFITDLSKMEKIVESNPHLFWEGWDVVQYKKNESYQFKNSGAFFRGKWHKKTVFPITEKGWSVPNYIGGNNV